MSVAMVLLIGDEAERRLGDDVDDLRVGIARTPHRREIGIGNVAARLGDLMGELQGSIRLEIGRVTSRLSSMSSVLH